ncbi:phage baseplate assembly protein V [Cupriavidus sp. BIC8F]|uniref:phage baseplate assembly protein V n=1 Tax=Cupriavidus sp. BIC8F TaxID=3079014 RepID=UPI00291645FC|nr:phage baseplate assembly protein V [Cupriavidus sp. BIC8F]
MWADVDKRISRALGGIRLAFRAVISRVNSGPAVQLVQADGLAGERLQDNELMQHYGFTSNPPAGTMAVVLPVGGKTSHGVIIATEHGSYRFKEVAPGELALYTDEGDYAHFKHGNIVEISTGTLRINASVKVELNTPLVEASQKLTVQGLLTGNGSMAISGGAGAAATITGSLNATVDVTANGTSLHGHRHNGDSGGVTSAPI